LPTLSARQLVISSVTLAFYCYAIAKRKDRKRDELGGKAKEEPKLEYIKYEEAIM
jgi:hypothetical protein